MATNSPPGINKRYITVVSLLTFLVPAVGTAAQMMSQTGTPLSLALAGKWFIFSAVGLRLLVAGIKQTTDPAFTAKEIFHIENPESFPIVRELGFANLCFGLVAIVSLFLPAWRVVSAFGSGLYYGMAGLQHFIKKPAGLNERFALVTDVLIFLALAVYFVKSV